MTMEQAERRARELLDNRMESVRVLVRAQQGVSDAEERMREAQVEKASAWRSAVQNGWSAEELKKLGIDEPVRVRKPRRREPSRQAGDAGQAVRESD